VLLDKLIVSQVTKRVLALFKPRISLLSVLLHYVLRHINPIYTLIIYSFL
jgi:hypothetical protein